MTQHTPTILREGQYDLATVAALKEKAWEYKDIYESQLRELFEIQHADLIDTPAFDGAFERFAAERMAPDPLLVGSYVYYPWSGLLLHILGEEELFTLRTNRTNLLVNPEEQQTLSRFTAGVAGLSFGNGIALAMAYSGISNRIKVADRDIFETTNLNRVRVGLPSVGEQKTAITAQDIYEINPYADVEVYDDGLTEENLESFITGDHGLDIVFDVVDDLAMKVRIRLAARKAKVPVVMLTSLEDSVLVDVERFDLDPEQEIFHGLLGDITEDLLTKEMTEQDKAKYAMAIVGPEHVSYRNLLSLSQVGHSLVSRPHLYGTVSIVCGLASYIAKRIALGEDMPSMRQHVRFNEILDIAGAADDTPERRNEIMKLLMERAKQGSSRQSSKAVE